MIGRAVQVVIDAISLGGLYALTALGIGLIFGVMRLINFAHAQLIMIAGYATLLLFTESAALAVLGAIVAAVLLALIVERTAFRPLRGADPAVLLIASFAVALLIEKTIIMVVGSRPKGVDFLPALAGRLDIGGIRLQLLQIVTIIVSILLLAATTWFLKATKLGLEMRAAAENFRMAEVLGIRANRVIATAFAISGLLAAAVACLYVAQTGLVQPRMGLQLVIIAFVGTVIGGLGSLPGAAFGGFLVGVVTILLQALLPPELRVFREAFLFLAVTAVLLLRPQGIMPGRGLKERV
jgi:branched-chain amino acid transport system permease protein